MIKNLLQVFIILSLSMISFNLFSQQKIVLKNYKGKFPVKAGWRGVRGVYELKKSITIVLDDQEILLPKKTIISDVDELGKVILPEGYTCTVKMGKHFILIKEGIIYFGDNEIYELSVDNDFLEIGGHKISFYNPPAGGVRFNDGKIYSGFLKNKVTWNHYGDTLHLDNPNDDNLYLNYNMLGNIRFYPNETLETAFLSTSTSLKTGDHLLKVNPGLISFYPNGKLKSCFLGEDKHFNGPGYSLMILKGNQVYLNEDGTLAKDKNMIVNQLKSKMFTEEIKQAKLHLNDKKEIILNEITIDKPLSIKVSVKTDKFNYVNVISFMKDDNKYISFYNNQTPWYGYLDKDQDVIIGDNNFKLKKGSFIRFHDNGMIEEAKLAEEKIITYLNKRYKLLPGSDLKFYNNGEINSDIFRYQNEAKGLVIALE